jgi:UDP-N-acetylmuramoylalanine-D-glutamate ligase
VVLLLAPACASFDYSANYAAGGARCRVLVAARRASSS